MAVRIHVTAVVGELEIVSAGPEAGVDNRKLVDGSLFGIDHNHILKPVGCQGDRVSLQAGRWNTLPKRFLSALKKCDRYLPILCFMGNIDECSLKKEWLGCGNLDHGRNRLGVFRHFRRSSPLAYTNIDRAI